MDFFLLLFSKKNIFLFPKKKTKLVVIYYIYLNIVS